MTDAVDKSYVSDLRNAVLPIQGRMQSTPLGISQDLLEAAKNHADAIWTAHTSAGAD